MADSSLLPFRSGSRSNWVRLRTVTAVRWIAIVGQLTAITVAQRLYNLDLEIGLCYLTVGLSVVGNLIAVFVLPQNKRLTEQENLWTIMFDLLQLSALLYLTGGLHNPFAMLLLGPVTVSAAVLSLRSTVIIGGTAILSASVLMESHLLLKTTSGLVLRSPDVFMFGTWVAIVIGVAFISVYTRRVTVEMSSMADALQATQMALAREQKLTDLGGVVAAAAHELGTPLATIKLASAELIEELDAFPDLKEDAVLIRDQADRCRDILRSMGRAGKDDLHLRQAPLITVVREAAEPHEGRGIDIVFEELPPETDDPRQPNILRRPEIIHGVRNLVQNAVDFATHKIWVEIGWTDTHITLRIIDDGKGFPPDIMGRIGDPFVRRRAPGNDRTVRPGYEGMGLGLFIAKTLLERSGAELVFVNGSDETQSKKHAEKAGAIVQVVWNRSEIDAQTGSNALGVGLNQPIEI